MKSSHIISVKSNCDFSLNYETGTLHPTLELILIATHPKYKLNTKKGELIKHQDVTDHRFKVGKEGLRDLIEKLQAAEEHLSKIDQMAESFNDIIIANKPGKKGVNEE